jgi:CheY-like chemotaxis protein
MRAVELLRLLTRKRSLPVPPLILYTEKPLSETEELQCKRLAEVLLLKRVSSPARLVHESSLFLQRMESDLAEAQRCLLAGLQRQSPAIAGRKILIVDDDIRNVFAITSVLEQHQANVVYADNGKDGLALLENTPGIDVVLMDIMMPELDGYEVIRRIRASEKHRALPIIAITAKAMRDDREKCIQAGASDYIAKPVDIERLLSMLRVWLQ